MACMLAKLDRLTLTLVNPIPKLGLRTLFRGALTMSDILPNLSTPTDYHLTHHCLLTPAFRNIDRPLTIDLEIIGRPRQLYKDTLQLLDDVNSGE